MALIPFNVVYFNVSIGPHIVRTILLFNKILFLFCCSFPCFFYLQDSNLKIKWESCFGKETYGALCEAHFGQSLQKGIEDNTCFKDLTHPILEYRLVSIQDFFIKLDIKPVMHLLEISTFSLNNVIGRLTKIMNRADKNWAHFQ